MDVLRLPETRRLLVRARIRRPFRRTLAASLDETLATFDLYLFVVAIQWEGVLRILLRAMAKIVVQ